MKQSGMACAILLAVLLCSWTLTQEGERSSAAPVNPHPAASYGDFLRAWESKRVSVSPPKDGSFYYVTLDDDGIDLILSVGSDFVELSRSGTRYALPLSGVVFRGW